MRIGVEHALGVADLHRLEHLERLAPRRRARPCRRGGAGPRSAGRRCASPGSARTSGPASPWRCAGRAGARICRFGGGEQVDAVEGEPARGDLPAAGIRRRMARPVMVLPLPDSPTMASRSRSSAKETPRTASTGPASVGKVTRRSSTSSRLIRGLALRGSSTSRRPSPSRLKPSETMKIASPGIVGDPPLVEQELAPRGDHQPPFRQRRLGAEAEEAEAGGGQDDAGHVERHPDDHRGHAHRRDVREEDARRRPRPAAGRRRCSRSCAPSASRRGRRGRRAARRSARSRAPRCRCRARAPRRRRARGSAAGRRGRCRSAASARVSTQPP